MFGRLFGRFTGQRNGTRAMLAALDKSQAIITFRPDGTIADANQNFLDAMGYRLDELKGRHHRIFVPQDHAESADHEAFWNSLRQGRYQTGAFLRLARGGREIWLNATYSPVTGAGGKVVRIVKYATDITEARMESAENKGQIEAIGKSQAVVHFHLDGTVISANQNFLDAMGYGLEEIEGQHHRMFVDPAEAADPAYERFWERLRNGEFQTGEYRRRSKDGRDVWIQASYNPILDPRGRLFKVVKFATDITAQKRRNADFEGQIAAISRSQAVITFQLDGTITDANQNFLDAVGYRLDEIKGQHHRIFVSQQEAASPEYAAFWRSLREGEVRAGEFRRLSKGGRDIWIQASYTPILDPSGRPFKIVKYATDITEQVMARTKREELTLILERNLGRILESVEKANAQSLQAANASRQTAETVNTVAAATEEVGVSAQEISKSMSVSHGAVEAVITEITGADASTQALANAAESMTSIISLIQDIAGQINLLALNATIESARAGEAGRGFSVVATEVKNLANQVASATDQISSEIAGVQTVSNEVVMRLSEITKSITPVQESFSSVASAVEQQSCATQEISASMQQASTSVNEINSNIAATSAAVEDINASLDEIRAAMAG